ncbi:MAG: GHKL domain-containing protein [Planctomycetes bacterium]|nr:GHKL domain-containing protein [Planctomycetota bacterium]
MGQRTHVRVDDPLVVQTPIGARVWAGTAARGRFRRYALGVGCLPCRAVGLWCSVIALTGVAGSQEHLAGAGFDVTVWSIAEGLPQGSVNGIVQTDGGELWLATFGGLSSFDGVRFRNLDLDSSPRLPSQRLTALALDRAGDLWIATQTDGLIRLRAGRVIDALPVPRQTEVLSLAIDDRGRPWIQASAGGIYCREGDAWTDAMRAASPGRYSGLCPGPEGTMWAASERGLVRFDSAGTLVQHLETSSAVFCLAQDAAGRLWAGVGKGLGLVANGELKSFTIDPPPISTVSALLPVDENHLWVGTAAGLCQLAREPGQSVFRVESRVDQLPSDFGVRWLLRDRESNVWAGSQDKGLARLRPHWVRGFSIDRGARPASALTAAAEGGTWMARDCTLLERFDDRGANLERLDLPLEAGKPLCAFALLLDSRKRLWIGSQGCVLRREGTRLERLGLDLALGRVTDLAEDAVGGIWIATADGTLRQFGPEDTLQATFLIEGGIDSLSPAPDGSLWVGGAGRLVRLQGGQLSSFGSDHGIPQANVRDILHDEDGGLWLATYGGGLARFQGGTAATITRAQGLPNASLTRVLSDAQGRLWIMSNAGLIVVPRVELLAVLAGRRTGVDAVLLGPEAGVSEANHGAPAGFKAPDGALVFGTVHGGLRIDPAEFPFNRVRPVPRIETVAWDESPRPPDAARRVPPQIRRLRFDYTTFALSVPAQVRFRHRLLGFDARWIDIGQVRSAEYSTLPPGEYTFEVEARNEHGLWSAEPARLAFTVLPAWWQVLWVQGLLFAVLLGGLLLLHNRRVAAVRRRGELLLSAVEGRRSAESREWQLREQLLHIGRVTTAGELASSLAHEVNQPLAAIVANASAARRKLSQPAPDPEELREILGDIAAQGERASEVIRRLREFIRKHETVREELSIAQLLRATLPLLRRELEQHGVQVELQLPEDLPCVSADRIQLQQVLVNLIHNACESLSGVRGDRRLHIQGRTSPGMVALQVRDNGPGLSPEVAGRLFQPYVTTKPGGMGLGLAICRTIVENHGGRLSAAPAPEGGAVFTIELPTRPNP